MARVKQEKSYTNFRGGFITEATPLAFPENTCRDINNCDIQLDGSVRRRLGFNIETGGGPLNPVFGLGAVAPQDSWAVTKHPWKAVAGRASLNFMVFQVGHYLIVRDWDADVVSSVGAIGSKVTGATEFTIPAAFHFLPTSLTPEREATPLSSASGFGRLWFTSPIHKPFYMEMDELGQLSLNELYTEEYGPTVRLAMRDFAGIEEPLRSDERPTTLSDEHLYNLFNQGWRRDYMTEVRSNRGTYPSNAEQWHAARQTSPDGIDVGLLSNIEFGNSLSPRGHTVLDVLRPDRRYGSERSVFTIPGLGTQYNDVALTSFSAVGFANGRLWLAGEINPKRPNGIYFSKILTKAQDAAVFMQVGDPCAEFFADILATDGGVIYIPEADTIERLEPYGAGILAFAHNGVWFIYGQERGFTADNYSVEKISSTGILGPRTVVRTDDSVFYWADNNIRTVAMPDRGVVPVVVDVSQDKIYTYYGLIPREARVTADACFDNVSKRVFWSWRQADSYSYPQYQSFFNRVLVLDTRTGAYSKYDFRLD